MARLMSFALTTDAIRRREKTVTRRTGWRFLCPGDVLQPVVKAQGLKKGEHVERIGGLIRVVSVTRERLDEMSFLSGYGRRECQREGFVGMEGREFVQMFCKHNGCESHEIVTRIEFEYLEESHA